MQSTYDYIIVGAGAAGCVLAAEAADCMDHLHDDAAVQLGL